MRQSIASFGDQAQGGNVVRRALLAGMFFCLLVLALFFPGQGAQADLSEVEAHFAAGRIAEGHAELTRLAEAGDIEAQLRLGKFHGEGEGGRINRIKAYIWYALAAKQGARAGEDARLRLAEEMNEVELAVAQELVGAAIVPGAGEITITPAPLPPIVASPHKVDDALKRSIENGAVVPLRQALGDGLEKDATHESGATLLSIAAAAGNVQAILELENWNADPNQADLNGDLPLRRAVDARELPAARALVAAGARPEAESADGRSSIEVARTNGDGPMLYALLGEPALEIIAGDPALLASLALGGSDRLLRRIVRGNADLALGPNGTPLLVIAAGAGSLSTTRLLVEEGAVIEDRDPITGHTALMAAAQDGHRQVVVYLLEKGAEPLAEMANGERASTLAEAAGHQEVADLLAAAETTRGLLRQMTRQAQQQLAELGYDPGPPDGSAGPRTSDAIRSFQEDNGQTVTGEVSPRLLADLQAARAAQIGETEIVPPPLPPAQDVLAPPSVHEAVESEAVPSCREQRTGSADEEAPEGDFWDDIGNVLGDGVEVVLNRFDSLERRNDFTAYCQKFPETWIWDNGTCELIHCGRWLHAENLD